VSELKSAGKPFEISKREVWEAWEKVRANKGAAGVDGCSIEDFEADLKNNLYKVWNRISSGSYFPPPVLAVEIPKPHGGGTRMLGVPTIADRVAQMVVARRLEVKVEPIFHPGSYGYRPGRSGTGRGGGLPATVLEVRLGDRSGHPEILRQRAVGPHRQGGGGQHRPAVGDPVCATVAAAPVRMPNGTSQQRDRGTPQGSAVSPVLANLFLHYAFDAWMARLFPSIPFERYVDDAVVHCVSQSQVRYVAKAIGERMEQVGLRLHRDKTRIVYCRDGQRRGSHEHTSFTFLGFTFRQRKARSKKGQHFSAFLPAVSKDALKKLSAQVRSGGCTTAPATPSAASPGGSTRPCEAGCSTTGRSTAPRCIPSCRASTPTWCAGSATSTNGCDR